MDKNHLIFDFQSTTPCSKKVVEEMAPYWNEFWGNPSNTNNRSGVFASAAVEVSREKIASFLNINPKRLIFTSGATEANNLGLFGHAKAKAKLIGKLGHIITVSTEHHAVLDPLRELQKLGFRLTEVQPNKDGLINIDQISKAVEKDTFLVSVMAANNEIGVVQPISEIGSFCKSKGIAFHTDAAQAFGYLGLDPDTLHIDLMSLSAHKIYGPKGIGALVIKEGFPLEPTQYGGGQELGLRSGTLPVPLIVGFAKAVEITKNDQYDRNKRLLSFRNLLLSGLQKNIPGLTVNGSMDQRLPHNLNITFPGVNGSRLHSQLKRYIFCTSGSACSNGEPSHVLQEIGLCKKDAESSIRMSIGRNTSEKDIKDAIEVITNIVKNLRK
tara:strand:- start:920 stop:2068 length:1149 start_codon:yes stop_codon:yes gene_type:complete